MDALTHYHPHTASEDRVSRPDLVQQLASHALRNVKNAHHVLKTIVPRPQYVTQLKPQPYTDSGKMQMMLH